MVKLRGLVATFFVYGCRGAVVRLWAAALRVYQLGGVPP